MWRLILITGIVFGLLMVAKGLRARSRRRKGLQQKGRVDSWTNATAKRTSIAKIVETNFGYGKEVWILGSAAEEIDFDSEAFKNGMWILPRPQSKKVSAFCITHSIPLIHKHIKWTN